MEERIDEGKIKGAIDAISLEKIEMITEQMKTCICQVYGKEIGTGFFCKIRYSDKNIPVLMTNYHIINDDFLQNNKELKITINNGKIIDFININEKCKIYSSIRDNYDIMIIKLEKEKDIYHYLELDEHLFNGNIEKIYGDKPIYILHYPMKKVYVSFGYGFERDNENRDYIKHFCNTEHVSSGSPILNLETNKVIGIHSGFINKEPKYNIGILLKYPLNELNKIKSNDIKKIKYTKPFNEKERNVGKESIVEKGLKKNSKKEIIEKKDLVNLIKINKINLKIKINKDDINRDIYFLDNTEGIYNGIKHYHDNLKELNESKSNYILMTKNIAIRNILIQMKKEYIL